MKVVASNLLVLIVLLCGCSRPVYSKEQVLRGTMIPLAQKFIRLNGLPFNADFGTNCIEKYGVDFYDKKPGCSADMKLTNGYFFMFFWDGTNSEIYFFNAIYFIFYSVYSTKGSKLFYW